MRDTIDMARQVYGTNTEWTDSQLERLEQLVALVRADEREQALAAPTVQEPVAWMSEYAVGFKKSEFGATPTVPLYTTPPAQPAVPDAFGTREGEHPEYIQGWNDCRAEMLKGRHEPV